MIQELSGGSLVSVHVRGGESLGRCLLSMRREKAIRSMIFLRGSLCLSDRCRGVYLNNRCGIKYGESINGILLGFNRSYCRLCFYNRNIVISR